MRDRYERDRYERSKLGTHFYLHGGHHWKLGSLLEFEWLFDPHYLDNELNIDFGPIIERDFGPINILLNPIVGKNLARPDSDAGLEASHAAQMLYHFSEHYAGGLQSYGDKGRLLHNGSPSQNQDYYVMTIVNTNFGQLKLSADPGFGLHGGVDQVVPKANLGYILVLFSPGLGRHMPRPGSTK